MPSVYVTGSNGYLIEAAMRDCQDIGYTAKGALVGTSDAKSAMDSVFEADVVLVLLSSVLDQESFVVMGLALAYGRTIYLVDHVGSDCAFCQLTPQDGLRTFGTTLEAMQALEEDLNVE